MNQTASRSFDDMLQKTQRYGVGAALVGGLAAVFGLFLVSTEAFFQGYLAPFVFWSGLSLGCLAVLMLHHVVIGAWGHVTQRILEAGALTVGLAAVLFVPFAFGLPYVYEWTHAEVVAEDPVLQHKRIYLNTPFFLIRALLYFATWGAFAYFLRRWSTRLDATGDPALAARLRRFATGGLVAHVLLITFASTDWIMSLDPHWFSTIFGWLIMVSQMLTALALTVLVLGAARHTPPLDERVTVTHFHDYGNLILAFVILWTYLMFMQYFIIWMGDIPEEITWYLDRQEGAWSWIVPILIALHFVIPFLVLLSRRSKRSVRALSTLAAGLLIVHTVYVVWLVLPSFHEAVAATYGITAALFVGMGGAWVAIFAWALGRHPLLPHNDPRYDPSRHATAEVNP